MGLALAAALWLAFMALTAYTSVATLLDRVASTDVMRAASAGAWSGLLALEMAHFVCALIALHLVFAIVTWLLAIASATVFRIARIKFGIILVGWFCLLAGAVLAFNALHFPRTLIGAYYHPAMSVTVANRAVGEIVYLAAFGICTLMLAWSAIFVLRQAGPTTRARSIVVGGLVAVSAAVALMWPTDRGSVASAATQPDRPHIIILGIDSLRLEQLRRFGGSGATPNLDRFLAEADLFQDTTTPLGRTFSSWMAILTGRSPTMTGARFNLAERSSVRANPTVADVLRKHGYRTVYSTDEVRFANFDESYGFDQVITPRIGASDFIIGTYNELPLSSLFINTRLGKWLFPFSYANRGVATMFDPQTYVQRLDHELQFDQPTLFISHLTAAHWPYYTAETPFGVSKPVSETDRPLYRIGLATADRMFGEIVAMLEAKGALKNAIIFVLSDHGEALGLPNDSFFENEFFRIEGMKAPLKMDAFGHGQSVLSQSQYRILLGLRAFGVKPGFGVEGRTYSYPVTAEDIAPTILDILRVEGDPLGTVGTSLRPLLDGGSDAMVIQPHRIRFTETDLRVLPGPGGMVDEAGTARQNSAFFAVDSVTARLHMRASFAPVAIAYKERAAFTTEHLLAAIPAGPTAHQYIFIDFKAARGRLLLARPANDDAIAQRLWDALSEHYRGELKPAVAITRNDWPRISAEWTAFASAAARNDVDRHASH